jgi:hypothetical protein
MDLYLYQYKKGERGADPTNLNHQTKIWGFENRPLIMLKQYQTDNSYRKPQHQRWLHVKKNLRWLRPDLIPAPRPQQLTPPLCSTPRRPRQPLSMHRHRTPPPVLSAADQVLDRLPAKGGSLLQARLSAMTKERASYKIASLHGDSWMILRCLTLL